MFAGRTGSLKWYPAFVLLTTDAPSRVKRGWEGSTPPARRQVWRMKPYVRAIQALTGPVHRGPDYIIEIIVATVPRGEWLGSSADEGRAKLR